MEIADPISSILHQKSSRLWQVSPDETVLTAIQLMAEQNVGALLVMDGGSLVGMVSERDYTRRVMLKGKSSKDTPVREIMSAEVVHVTPCSSVEDCLSLMTSRRVRHLPVMDDNRVVGLVSTGDLVRWIISAQKAHIDQLGNYIMGAYPA